MLQFDHWYNIENEHKAWLHQRERERNGEAAYERKLEAENRRLREENAKLKREKHDDR